MLQYWASLFCLAMPMTLRGNYWWALSTACVSFIGKFGHRHTLVLIRILKILQSIHLNELPLICRVKIKDIYNISHIVGLNIILKPSFVIFVHVNITRGGPSTLPSHGLIKQDTRAKSFDGGRSQTK